MQDNPYRPPESDVATDLGLPDPVYNHLANGQKMVIYACILYLIGAFTATALGPWVLIPLLAALLLGVIGVVRVLIGIDSHIAAKIIYVLMMFLPLLNLLALARINGMATKKLRAAGYTVGFFGVSQKPAS